MEVQATAELTDDQYRKLLKETKCFACVGVSANPLRPSYFVIRYLALAGYRVIPVNPAYEGSRLFGEKVVADLASIPAGSEPDIVDIFRRPQEVPAIVEDAVSLFPNLKAIWMQIGIWCPEAAAIAESNNVIAIQNRCPKIERQRLFGELRMAGFNTRVISSRLKI